MSHRVIPARKRDRALTYYLQPPSSGCVSLMHTPRAQVPRGPSPGLARLALVPIVTLTPVGCRVPQALKAGYREYPRAGWLFPWGDWFPQLLSCGGSAQIAFSQDGSCLKAELTASPTKLITVSSSHSHVLPVVCPLLALSSPPTVGILHLPTLIPSLPLQVPG